MSSVVSPHEKKGKTHNMRIARVSALGRFALDTCKHKFGLPCDPGYLGAMRLKAINDEAMATSSLERKSLTTASGETITYAERPAAGGKPASRTVVFAHGIGNDMTILSQDLPSLMLPPDVRLLCPEGPGHGERVEAAVSSGAYEYSYRDRAVDLGAFVDAVGLETDEQFDLMGYSMGGGVALSYVAVQGAKRIRRAAILCPAICSTPEIWAKMLAKEPYAGAFHDVKSAQAYFEKIGLTKASAAALAPGMDYLRRLQAAPPDYWATIASSLGGKSPGPEDFALMSDLTDVPAVKLALDGAAALGAVGVPTMVVQGTLDSIVNASVPAMLQRVYDAEQRPDGGAKLHIEMLDGVEHAFVPGVDPPTKFFGPAFAHVGRHFGHVGDDAAG